MFKMLSGVVYVLFVLAGFSVTWAQEVTVKSDPQFAGGNASWASGVVGQQNITLGIAVNTNTLDRQLSIIQIEVVDQIDEPNVSLADLFQNMRVSIDGMQFGDTVGTLQGGDGASYPFFPKAKYLLTQNSFAAIRISADVRSSITADAFTAINEDTNGPIRIIVTLKDEVDGVLHSVVTAHMQAVFIERFGTLEISLDSSVQPINGYLPGDRLQEGPTFKFVARNEPIEIRRLDMGVAGSLTAFHHFYLTANTPDGPKVCSSASNVGRAMENGTYAVAPFAGMSVPVARDDMRRITPHFDVSDDAKAGSSATFVFRKDSDPETEGIQSPVIAVGVYSGVQVPIIYGPDNDNEVRGSKITVGSAEVIPEPIKKLWALGIIATVNAAVEPSYTKTQILEMGVAVDATNGVDPQYKEVAYPPPPPAGVADVRFISPTSDALVNDFRSPSRVIEWTIQYQGGSLGLMWNPAILPPDGTFTLIVNGFYERDMRGQETFSFGSAQGTFIIRYQQSQTFVYDLVAGWNMVSIPVSTRFHLKDVFKDATVAYSFDSGYAQVDSLFPGTGYWVYLAEGGRYSVSGDPIDAVNYPSVKVGWHLVGVPYLGARVSEIRQDPAGMIVSVFDMTSPVGTMKPGVSYWVNVKEQGSFSIEGNPEALSKPVPAPPMPFGIIIPPRPPYELFPMAPDRGGSAVPKKFKLQQNFPNPFNPETTIRYELANVGEVQLAIYNILGQEIRQLVSEFQLAGSYSVVWDGRDALGRPVSSGMYIYHLVSGAQSKTKQMLLLK